MQKIIRKADKTFTWTDRLIPRVSELPTAIVALGMALTLLWAAVILWFAFNWVLWRIFY